MPGTVERMKKPGLSQARPNQLLICNDLDEARLAVPASFHTFPSPRCAWTDAIQRSVGSLANLNVRDSRSASGGMEF